MDDITVRPVENDILWIIIETSYPKYVLVVSRLKIMHGINQICDWCGWGLGYNVFQSTGNKIMLAYKGLLFMSTVEFNINISSIYLISKAMFYFMIGYLHKGVKEVQWY